MITPEQAQQIKAGLAEEKTLVQVASDAGVNKSTVERVNRLYIRKGKFAEFLEKAEQMASKGKSKPKKHKKPFELLGPKTIANIRHLRKQGVTIREISERLDVSANRVWYYTTGKGAGENVSKLSTPRKDNLNQKIFALREKGLTLTAIAEKLEIPLGTVHSRMYAHGASKHSELSKEQSNGAGSTDNGNALSVNKYILFGIAYAETERFIGVLSERLGVPAKVLRPRLSELLGHSPVRESSGHGN